MTKISGAPARSSACRATLRLCLKGCLLSCIAAGTLSAQQTSNGQTSPKLDAPNPAQTDAQKAPGTPSAATPTVTDPHQAQIIADTQKLVKLSEELKAEVAKSSKDTLSLTVIKKAEQVEKQAKLVKEELNKSH